MAHTSSMDNSPPPSQTVAGFPLLETKLYLPRWRAGFVSRPRLVARLDQGAERKLTLVSAPAGFGKSTLLAEWLATTAASARAVAWVSLDPNDNDPARFWAYVITALRAISSEIGTTALSLLPLPQPPPIDVVLTTLINDLAAIECDVALILDDLHLIEAQPIHDGIAFLLDHLPPRLHLTIASRSDPPLPLARLRGRGDVTELRAADLRFTPDEAATFLNEAMGLNLAAADVAALESRTEGWIAGLQLAALSMQRRDDVSGFIRAFAGDDRYILDFLVEEVLQRQPDRVRRFLLQTAILDRLSGPLCDAVTDENDGLEMLAGLERANLFVVPLDDRRRWYRYHHLFADVLHVHAMAEQPGQVPVWHQRASLWYGDNGFRADAIRHALAAGDVARAAGLIELAALRMLGSSQETTLYGWLTALPDDVVRARPVLSVYYGYASLGRDGLDAAEARLRDAERWLGTSSDGSEPRDPPPGEMVVMDDQGFRSLAGTIAVARAYMAGARGDVAGIVTFARRAIALLPADDDLWSGAAAAILGIGYWTNGELEAAYRSFADGKARWEAAGYTQFQITSVHVLAEIRIAQGRLNEAERIYQEALHLATARGELVWGTADLHVGLGELCLERDDLETAQTHLLTSQGLSDHGGMPDTRHRWSVVMARVKEAQGDGDAALALLDEAERQYLQGADPDVRPIAALRARVWVTAGRLDDAIGWVRERGLTVEDDLTYLREFAHITLVRVLIAQATRDGDDRALDNAVDLLARLLTAADSGDRTGSAIEMLVLQSLALQVRGDVAGALVPLKRAIALAETDRHVHIFVAEGEAMRELLRQTAAHENAPGFTWQILAAFDRRVPASASPPQPTESNLIEPLTAREIEILRLIAAGNRNQEIADHLFISLATVKRHIANVYGKLGVTHRTQAAARATQLKLL